MASAVPATAATANPHAPNTAKRSRLGVRGVADKPGNDASRFRRRQEISRRVVAFRLERLGLGKRSRDVGGAVGEVGLTDFPPGAALAALAPRLSRRASRARRRRMTRSRSARGSPERRAARKRRRESRARA
jgi:hypothetical protein